MKLNVLPITLTALAGLGVGAQAQGLLSIGSDDDFYSALPFTTSIGVEAGWDSNPASSSISEDESGFIRSGIEMAYGSPSRTTPVKFGLGASGLYYFDDVAGQDEEVFYDIRFTLNASHAFSRRLKVGNNLYVAYEIEPNLAIGAANQRRLDQYLYAYDSLWASYRLSRRLSAITRYTVSGIRYDDSAIGDFEDRLTQTLGEEIRYELSRQTTLVGEYRFTYTNYDSAPRDYIAHTLLGGFDHNLSRTLLAHVRAGAEFRDADEYGDETRPYAELALRQRLSDVTQVHWVNRVGLEDSELTTYESRYTYRSALSASHEFSSRLRAFGGVTYLHNEFEDSDVSPDISEDLVSANVGLGYRLFSNIDLTAAYTFTGVASDNDFREYDRHRVSLGLKATFE